VGSKFKSILDAAREPVSEVPAAAPSPPQVNDSSAPSSNRLGRPPTGKKSNPAYQQVTAYVRRDLYRDVRIALLQDPRQPDFSDLIDELLERWHRDLDSPKAKF
jgi:hypothetical protein